MDAGLQSLGAPDSEVLHRDHGRGSAVTGCTHQPVVYLDLSHCNLDLIIFFVSVGTKPPFSIFFVL